MSEVITTKTEFLAACCRAAKASQSIGIPITNPAAAAIMMPGFTDVDASTRASGIAILGEAEPREQLWEDR